MKKVLQLAAADAICSKNDHCDHLLLVCFDLLIGSWS